MLLRFFVFLCFVEVVLKAPNFFISEHEFRVWNPCLDFIAKSGENEDAYNSRQIKGIMSTAKRDRQGEVVIQKGLIFSQFLEHGHFNDNHSQETSAVVGYPEKVEYSKSMIIKGEKREGWVCDGYILKGYRRADDIWELAKALQSTPDKRLGFSIEGKAIRRANGILEKALVRNMAITNCPVNTDATWDVLEKSFRDEDIAMKSLSAGYGGALGPAGQSGGSALSPESLEKDKDKRDKKLKRVSYILRSYGMELNDILKAFDYVNEIRPDFDDEAAAELVGFILKSKGVAA